MPNDTRELQSDAPILLAWGLPTAELPERFLDGAWWATAGASLLAWTALALVLTS
jgi:hypothetical protein